MASSSTSWLSGAAERRIEATNEKAAKEKARREAIGVLKKRPATVLRKAGELDAIVARYLNGTMGLIFTETCADKTFC